MATWNGLNSKHLPKLHTVKTKESKVQSQTCRTIIRSPWSFLKVYNQKTRIG